MMNMNNNVMKDAILLQRKEIKEKSHQVLRSHYFVLTFLMIVLSLLGVEFHYSLTGWEKGPDFFSTKSSVESTTAETEAENKEADPGNMLSEDDLLTSSDVFWAIAGGNLDDASSKADRLLSFIKDKSSETKALGRSRGVFAQIVNAFGSGKLFAKTAQALRTITQSDSAVAIIFVILAFLWYALVFVFIKNVYSAAIRRVFLEARMYTHVSSMDITFFFSVRKWVRASTAMIVMYVYQALWNLTIIGGLIKLFSYWAVPYIVAENPGISGNQAVTLSRRMMDGHKLELLKFEISLFGWFLLSLVTFGISDLVYGAGYRMACYAEFYARVREQAIQNELEGTELLNDPYLFTKADRILLYETYFDVVDEITDIHENKAELTGWRKKVADWTGLWLGTTRRKREYDTYEGRRFAIEGYKRCMEGLAYPLWLNPLWTKKTIEKHGQVTYLRCYTVWSLLLLFIFMCFIGWSWEVALHFIQTGEMVNRGTMHGPWLPIYGSGGILALIACTRFRKKPVVEFFSSVVLCGVLEYFSAWHLEMKYHQRWWSYDGYFLNLHGRICAEGLLIFGIGCCTVVYVLAPLFDEMLSRIKIQVLIVISIVVGTAYTADLIYSSGNPNMSNGAIVAVQKETEETGETEDGTLPPVAPDS